MRIRRLQLISLLVTLAALVSGSGCAGNASSQAAKGKGKKGADNVPVATAIVSRRDVPVEIQVIGNVEAYSTVIVKAQVTGLLEKVFFHEGDFVRKGDELFRIDPAPFQAALSEAEANLARNRALLEQARANLSRDLAQQRFQLSQAGRFANLLKEGIISKDQAEQIQSSADAIAQAVKADQAAIESAQASVQAGEAAVKNARIQLGYTSIRSPIDGRTGTLTTKEGNLVTANTTELVSINQVEPVYVSFAVPESQLPVIKEYMARSKLPVSVSPPDDRGEPETGVLTFVDNRVDAATGTIRLKGTFSNTHRRLWPGQFVRVRLRLGIRPGALLVPNQAVQTGQDGPFVYRVRPDSTVEVAKVVAGARIDQDIVIEQGLQAGDTVVTEGQLRLAPGMRVRLREGDRGAGKRS